MVNWFKNLFNKDKYKIGELVNFETDGSYNAIRVEIVSSLETKHDGTYYTVKQEYTVHQSELDWYN